MSSLPAVGMFITEGFGLYEVLAQLGGTHLRVRSAISGVEITVDWADSGYLDQERHGWRIDACGVAATSVEGGATCLRPSHHCGPHRFAPIGGGR